MCLWKIVLRAGNAMNLMCISLHFSLNLCEQKCSVYFGRVICTCFAGFKFNQTLHKISAEARADDPNSDAKSCQDVDECLEDNGGCQHVKKTF